MSLRGFYNGNYNSTIMQAIINNLQENEYITGTGHINEELNTKQNFLSQHYGFASYPLKDTEIILATTESGDKAAIAEHVERPELEQGQVKLYDEEGNYILLKYESGGIHIEDKNGTKIVVDQSITIDTGDNELTINTGASNTEITANNVYLKAPVKLGTASANNPILLGTNLIAAFTAYNTTVQTLPVIVNFDTATTFSTDLIAAIATLSSEISKCYSKKHYLDE